MSLLSNLIVELSALLERSRESQSTLRHAHDQLEAVLTTVQASTVGSRSSLVDEGIGHLRAGLVKLEEAQRLLNSGDDRWRGYVSVLGSGPGAGSGTPSSASARPAPRPVRGPAAKGVNPPADRHRLVRIGRSSPAAKRNTVVLPEVDVDADIDAIRAGRARWNPSSNRYEVNGRTWAMEPSGTTFPVSGPGLVALTRSQYKALKLLCAAKEPVGVWPKSYGKDPSISQADWDRAAEVYRYHPRHTEGAR